MFNKKTYDLECRINDLEQRIEIIEKRARRNKIQDAINIIEKNITTDEEKIAWNFILIELGCSKYQPNRRGIR